MLLKQTVKKQIASENLQQVLKIKNYCNKGIIDTSSTCDSDFTFKKAALSFNIIDYNHCKSEYKDCMFMDEKYHLQAIMNTKSSICFACFQCFLDICLPTKTSPLGEQSRGTI